MKDCLHSLDQAGCAGPDLGGRDRGARAPGLPPTGASHQTPQFFGLMIDVSLVILIEDFEINVVF